ncbi:MAG: class I tRNA ligase family protein, partial [Bdellovibrionota bacterium]
MEALKKRVYRPKRAVVTSGMPYANGPLHVGHLAGAQVPGDVYARWMRMLIGAEN